MPELDVTLYITGKRSCLIHFVFFDIIKSIPTNFSSQWRCKFSKHNVGKE